MLNQHFFQNMQSDPSFDLKFNTDQEFYNFMGSEMKWIKVTIQKLYSQNYIKRLKHGKSFLRQTHVLSDLHFLQLQGIGSFSGSISSSVIIGTSSSSSFAYPYVSGAISIDLLMGARYQIYAWKCARKIWNLIAFDIGGNFSKSSDNFFLWYVSNLKYKIVESRLFTILFYFVFCRVQFPSKKYSKVFLKFWNFYSLPKLIECCNFIIFHHT